MDGIQQIPEWFGGAMIGAVIAALGYVAKLILSWFGDSLAEYRSRKAGLVEFYSLLCATRVAFKYQAEIRNRLHDLLKARDEALVSSGAGYERDFSDAYPSMTEDERELHALIRAYTVYALYPLNREALQWLKNDTFYKSREGEWKSGKSLRDLLTELEGHLLLWIAKYEMWIPDEPSHALVYLADENKHGLGFPNKIDARIKEVVDARHWLYG